MACRRHVRAPVTSVVSTTGRLVLGGAVVALALAWAFGWIELPSSGSRCSPRCSCRSHSSSAGCTTGWASNCSRHGWSRANARSAGWSSGTPVPRRRRRRGWSCPSAPGSPSSSCRCWSRAASTRSSSPFRPTGGRSSWPGRLCRCAATSSACSAGPCGGPTPSSSSCIRARHGSGRRRRASCATSRARSRGPSRTTTSRSTRCVRTSPATRCGTCTGARRPEPVSSWCANEETRRSQLILVQPTEREHYASDDEFELAVSVLASIGVQVIRDATQVAVVTEDLALRTATPTALLDDTSRIEPVRRAFPSVRDFVRDATKRLPPPSVVIVVGGSLLRSPSSVRSRPSSGPTPRRSRSASSSARRRASPASPAPPSSRSAT